MHGTTLAHGVSVRLMLRYRSVVALVRGKGRGWSLKLLLTFGLYELGLVDTVRGWTGTAVGRGKERERERERVQKSNL